MAKDNKKLVQAITSQEENFAQWYTDICVKAELVEYSSVKGFIILRPYGQAIWELIQKDMDARFKATGHENVAMPVLIPESLLQKEGELVNGFAPEVAWVTMGGSDKLEERLAVRPTSETMFCDHWSRVLHSYRELPMKYNQWCSVVRWEKTTRPLLPPELAAAQEGAGGLFPADNAAPLVVLHGKLTVAVQHAGPVVAEHGLAGGTHGQTLFQLVGTAHRDPRHLRREAIDQFAFLLQQAFRDQHGHCHVLMAGGLEAGIHVLLDQLPDGLTVGAQDDETLHAGVLHQLCLHADIGVPLCEVLFLAGDRLYELL